MLLEEDYSSAIMLEDELDSVMILENEDAFIMLEDDVSTTAYVVLEPENNALYYTILRPDTTTKTLFDVECAIELYNSGKSLRQIAKELGIYHQLVAEELRKLNIITKNETKDTASFIIDTAEAVKLYKEGHSCHAIAKKLGVSQSKTIKKHLELSGIIFDKPANAHKKTALDNAQIKVLFENKLNYRQIAIKLGTSSPTIKTRLKKMGLV